MMEGLAYMLLAYVVGSIPSGLIIGKVFFHTDIRKEGSHNTGATNAYRLLGKAGGLAVLICDMLKGFLAYTWGNLRVRCSFQGSWNFR